MPDPTSRPYHHGNLRAALLEAAESALRSRGADGLSLRDLAREVGVSHAAPRRHFPDRQALLDALAETGFARLDAALRDALEPAGPAFPARLRAAATAYARFATDNAALLEVMFAGKHRPGATRVVEAAAAPFGRLHELATQGEKEEALGPGDADRAGTVLFATLQGLATLVNGDMVPSEQLDGLVDTAVTQFLRGARPPRNTDTQRPDR